MPKSLDAESLGGFAGRHLAREQKRPGFEEQREALAGVAGWRFALLGAAAHFAFLVLFSYSFFHEGLSGITITVGAVATLAMLMALTAKTDWNATFNRAAKAKAKGAVAVA